MKFKILFLVLIFTIFFSLESCTTRGVISSDISIIEKSGKEKENQTTVTLEKDPINELGQFLETLTGEKNIVRIFGDIDKVKELKAIIDSGDVDESGRRYFEYTSMIRANPTSSLQQRFDLNICLSDAKRKLHSIMELPPDIITLIARRLEVLIRYTVDRGNNNYGYGEYLIASAIVLEEITLKNREIKLTF